MKALDTESIISIVKSDLVPSLGVTEPAAIAYAAAVAQNAVGGRVQSVSVKLNSGIYKNSFTCAVPNSNGCGCAYAAALGAVAGNAKSKLMALDNVTDEDIEKANRIVESKAANVELGEISAEIYIYASVVTDKGTGEALIKNRHDNVTLIKANGITLYERKDGITESDYAKQLYSCSLKALFELSMQADITQLKFLEDAVKTDIQLYEYGRNHRLIPLTLARTGNIDSNTNFTDNARESAILYTCGAVEARVRGAAAPAIAITGSGSHGILCMLPIHAAALAEGIEKQAELRAILFSCIVTMYIKSLSGRLSSACGCVMAGGTGAALGLAMLYGGGFDAVKLTLATMAASVTG